MLAPAAALPPDGQHHKAVEAQMERDNPPQVRGHDGEVDFLGERGVGGDFMLQRFA